MDRLRPHYLIAVALSLALTCTSCSMTVWRVTECDTLVFGLSKPDGSLVSDVEWQQFVNDELTAHFPDGMTIVEARGQWRGASGTIVREPSRVVFLVHPHSKDRDVQAVIDAYKQRFAQEAVMRVQSDCRVLF